MSSIVFTCPLDGLALKTEVLPTPERLDDVDGDFTRDKSQHVHMPAVVEGECSNGHNWRCVVDLVLERVPRPSEARGAR